MPAPKGGNKTSFKKGKPKPPRGKSFKNKLLQVVEQEAKNDLGKLLGVSRFKELTPDKVEASIVKHMAKRAFNKKDPASAMLTGVLAGRMYPQLKATLPEYVFEFPEDGTTVQNITAIIEAAAAGEMPPDVAEKFVTMERMKMEIETGQDMVEKFEKLQAIVEALIKGDGVEPQSTHEED